MSNLRSRMDDDRFLRNSARALVEADVAHLRGELTHKGLSERAMNRIAEGASDVYDEAVEVASDHKGALAAIVAALVMWFARNPILALFESDEGGDDDAEGREIETSDEYSAQ